jgi:spore germination cell wall hydrolase CwlJ-like protein
MGVSSPNRFWHIAAVLAPLPLIGLGYASIPGNFLSYRLDLLLSGGGSAHAMNQPPEAAGEHRALPSSAAALFRKGGKGPRADQQLLANTETAAEKQFIAASASEVTGSVGTGELLRSAKADRLGTGVTEVALRNSGPNSSGMLSLFDAPAQALFLQPAIDFEPQRPAAETIAYRPSEAGIGFKSKGESQAEFEERERRCLATAIYFEARGEPARGQIAVGQVIMNRVRSPQFPETICGVVYQGQMAPGCQFSFACDGKTDVPRNDAQWGKAQALAKEITSGRVWLPEVGYSTFYHANYVRPGWVNAMNKIDKIGRHIFYKKRHEQPYIVEDSTTDNIVSVASVSDGGLSGASPTLSLSLGSSE